MIAQLANDKDLKLNNVRHFIIDECDKVLDGLGKSPPFVLQLLSGVLKAHISISSL